MYASILTQNSISHQMPNQQEINVQNTYFISLLQSMDTDQIDKIVQVQVVGVLRKLLKIHSNLVQHSHFQCIFFYCARIILNQSQSQNIVANPILDTDVSQVDPNLLESLQESIFVILNDFTGVARNPYEMLNNIFAASSMSSQMQKVIKLLIDFALVLPQTFDYSAYDLLHSCFSIYLPSNNNVTFYLGFLEDKISTNAHHLAHLIQSKIEENVNI